jgi:hypothetical protein
MFAFVQASGTCTSSTLPAVPVLVLPLNTSASTQKYLNRKRRKIVEMKSVTLIVLAALSNITSGQYCSFGIVSYP